ncbi:MAG: HD domain-containing protein [Candidatus Woesearchaeota archaeon]
MIPENFYEELKEKINPYYYNYGTHGITHTNRVYNLSLKISKNEKKIDIDVIKTAALLHDVARKLEDESKEKICHAIKGSKLAREILNELNFPKYKIKNVCHCIKVHRYSKNLKPETKEAEIIQDADRLDAIGAIAIARVFNYESEKDRPLHIPNLNPKDHYNGLSETAITHFHEKILKIKPESFNTKTAKKIARERYDYVKDYVDRFIKEWNGEL